MKKHFFMAAAVAFSIAFFAFSPAYADMVSIGVPKKTLVTGDTWLIGGGYSVTVASIDANNSQAWLQLKLDGVAKDDAIFYQSTSTKSLWNGQTEVFKTKLTSTFKGATSDMAQFASSSVNSIIIGGLTTPTTVLVQAKKTLTPGEVWSVGGGYSLSVMSADAKSSPRQVWLVFTKNCSKLDDKIAAQGETYAYGDVFSAKVDSIFAGATNDLVQFTLSYVSAQYDVIPLTLKTESWTCGEWSSCANGQQNRSCSDANNCGTALVKPETTQDCVMPCSESWNCDSWSDCTNNQQTRTCSDANNCGTTANKPAVNQFCETCQENWSCGAWSTCENGNQSRMCIDKNNCATLEQKPEESRGCVSQPACVESWTCEAWSTCENGVQRRTCKDANNCGTVISQPDLKQGCQIITIIASPTATPLPSATPPSPAAFSPSVTPKAKPSLTPAAKPSSTPSEKPAARQTENVQVTPTPAPSPQLFQSRIEDKPAVIEKKSENETLVKIGETTMATELETNVSSTKIYVKTSGGEREIKKLPQLDNVYQLRILDDNGKAVYSGFQNKRGKFLFILPVNVKMTIKASAETGQLISVKKPWWSFLVREI